MVFRSLKLHGQALVAALQFLTRLPIPLQVPFEPAALARSVIYFPAAGTVVGVAVASACGLLDLFMPSLPAAVIIVAIWAAMSGGLHLDGWMDTADGVLSHRSRERMLEIMKDSRVGAMGVIAAVLLLLFKFAVIAELFQHRDGMSATALSALAAIPLWSRWWMSVAIVGWPSARQGEGVGALFQKAGIRQAIAGFALTIALTCISLWTFGMPIGHSALWSAGAASLTALIGSVMAAWLCRKLGGLTGDTYGALNEMIEASLLLALLLALN
ncbi:adenosylcobinamide-GDP ribazoletransferase [Paenibacillus sp. NEAU-GSW1]|uniref:adenosylcobinamide-GDP ribazoletransferase n=1 Tax=Paenibacillus sp. NEAU-GSW1 TaxID=2682486 RepID=UPI0012E21D52|nr:adenosylcobinamide-GDP ribazoletransferase [Paenibacillus sp. NEAU-GSW1]MUT67029.1 adenosylcobinamide-GDP ribazoletransferase [Paenibacillus sp. NEAU-GSW1]